MILITITVIFILIILFASRKQPQRILFVQNEVESLRGWLDLADDVGGVGFEAEVGGVAGGDLEAVEQSGGPARLEMARGQGVDDHREGELDGLAVFERDELDVLPGYEVAPGGRSEAKARVTLMEAVVEVAPGLSGEGWGFAAGSVGLDVTAECNAHKGSL